uniref:Coiled-coil domain containing 30 n=1 Tax=Oryctolagus cuniculus TaxID=9986 RepID=A0A5F9CEY9_RABIT
VSSARRCCALGRGYGPLCGQTGRAGPPGGVGHVRRHQGPVGSAASPLFGQLQQRRRGALARLLLRATGSCSCTPLPPLPFAHRFPPQTWLAALRPSGPAHSGLLSLEAEENALPGFAAALQSYQEAAAAGTFLAVEFTTLADYLHLLQAAAQALNPLGSSAMFYLAAAVSDFYVPVSEMPEHKIQSSAGALQSHNEDLEKNKTSQNCIERGVEHIAKRLVMAHAEIQRLTDELQEKEKEQSESDSALEKAHLEIEKLKENLIKLKENDAIDLQKAKEHNQRLDEEILTLRNRVRSLDSEKKVLGEMVSLI